MRATTPNSSANIVKAVGAGVGTCSGVQAPGDEGTFYAGAIDAAQAYLTANARPNAYGSETSGCTSGESAGYTTPCLTMQNIASSPSATYFFSVPQEVNGSQSTVCSGVRPDTNLNQVFTDMAGDLTSSRLIPNNTP